MTRAAPAFVPRQPAVSAQPAATRQPKPVIRAQGPEEPNPARPPLLALPSPEQLGVAVRPVEDAADWTTIHTHIKELGILSFHMDTLADGRSRFTCWMPGARPDLTRRIESVANSQIEAAQGGLREAFRMRQENP